MFPPKHGGRRRWLWQPYRRLRLSRGAWNCRRRPWRGGLRTMRRRFPSIGWDSTTWAGASWERAHRAQYARGVTQIMHLAKDCGTGAVSCFAGHTLSSPKPAYEAESGSRVVNCRSDGKLATSGIEYLGLCPPDAVFARVRMGDRPSGVNGWHAAKRKGQDTMIPALQQIRTGRFVAPRR